VTTPRAHDPRITVIQRELADEHRSRAERYADLVVGRRSWAALLKYEVITMAASGMPGALGLWLRSKLYPRLLGGVGCNVVFGQHLVLRHPHKIRIGDHVVIDDGCCLDAKGQDNRGITIGNGVFIGRGTILSCKNGDIVIEDEANLGFNTEVFSASRVRIGKKVLVAAYTYLVGGDHLYDRADLPVLDQGRTARGIDVGDHVWLGAHVVGAIPEYGIAVGIPAKTVRDRREE
jgi:acetyltransferase-like isoleucine patch superfamily enzyme